MHNYSVDNRFTTKTKVGNWYEESQLQEYEFKEYLHQKDNNGNITLKTASKLQFSAKPVNIKQCRLNLVYPKMDIFILVICSNCLAVMLSLFYHSICMSAY